MGAVICKPGCTCGRHNTAVYSQGAERRWANGAYATRPANTNLPTRSEEHRVAISSSIKRAWTRGAYRNVHRSTEEARRCFTGGDVGQVFADLLLPLGYMREFRIQWGGDALRDVYKLDFALPEQKIDIELDGPYHSSFGDVARDKRLRTLGWKIIRIRHGDNL